MFQALTLSCNCAIMSYCTRKTRTKKEWSSWYSAVLNFYSCFYLFFHSVCRSSWKSAEKSCDFCRQRGILQSWCTGNTGVYSSVLTDNSGQLSDRKSDESLSEAFTGIVYNVSEMLTSDGCGSSEHSARRIIFAVPDWQRKCCLSRSFWKTKRWRKSWHPEPMGKSIWW